MAVLSRKLQLSSMVLHNRLGKTEPQSGTFTHFLGGEKWLHDLGFQLRRNPRPAVGYGKLDLIILHLQTKTYPPLSRLFGNCIECVLEQVQQDLGNLDLAATNG